MNTKDEIKRVKEQLSAQDYSTYSFDELIEQYDTLKALDVFENTEPTYFSNPSRKAKEIALQAAISMRPSPSYNGNFGQNQPVQPHYDLLKEAEAIYQWLIKSE